MAGAMEQRDRRPASEEEDESTQETRESCSSQPSSLEMDCSEPYGDHIEGSNNQEMKSASSSLESYMDCSEEKEEEENEEEEEEEKERRKENEDNDGRISGTCIRNSSLSLTVSSVIGETETSNGNESGDQSLHRESLSQDLSVTVQMNISVTSGHDVNSSQTHKRKISEEGQENMNKRRKSEKPDSTAIQVVFTH